MSKSSKRIKSLLFVFVVSVSLVGADLVVLAQNENTQDDTTRGGQMTSNTQNGNMTGGNTNTGTGGRRRRGRRRSSSASAGAGANTSNTEMSGNASMTTDQGNTTVTGEANMNMSTGGRRRRRGRRRSAGAAASANVATDTTMTANVSGGEQTDLSGTYTGTVDYPEGGLTGDATLTITGNNFTLTAGSATQNGRITAVTTRGYTAVTMMFGDLTPPAAGQAPPPLPAVSLRARRVGTSVTLNSVPGEKRRFAFSVTGGRVGGRRRGRRGGGAAGVTTTGDMSGNANMTTGDTGAAGTETNTNTGTGGRRRRGRRRGGNANTGGGNDNMGGGNMNMGGGNANGNGNTPPE
ncbi:MAG TPA: hypothetical protein VF708_13410 [Pyrinomonadaceae bacterium]